MFVRTLAFIFLSLLLSSCSFFDVGDGNWVASEIECRTGYDVIWQRSCCEEEDAASRVAQLLEQELTLHSAVQIALLNNPSLQASFEKIGIAQSALLAASIPRNPIIEWELRNQTNSSARRLDIQWTLTGFLFDIFLVPMRHSIAKIDLYENYMLAAHEVIDLTYRVQTAYYNLQAANAKLELLKSQEESANTKLAVLNAEMNVITAEEQLTKSLGILKPPEHWKINNQLPDLPEKEEPIEQLLQVALISRYDLQAARLDFKKLSRSHKIHAWWTYLDPQGGPTQQRNPDDSLETGGVLLHTIPIFNYGQADRATLRTEVRQSLREYQSLVVNAFSDIRLASSGLLNARESIDLYRNEIMATRAKDDPIDAKSGEIDLLLNYWTTHAQLESAMGGTFARKL